MKRLTLPMLLLGTLPTLTCAQVKGWKDVVKDDFLIGTAVSVPDIDGHRPQVAETIKQHFNAIVAENCMKNGPIHPEENRYNFTDADKTVQFAQDNHLTLTGHCLMWHSQAAPWFFTDKDGKQVTAKVLKQRMKSHIFTVMRRYKGKIKGWDVVNEAVEDNGTMRQSLFYKILGDEFIPLAFKYAHEADPDAELYYNDYNMAGKQKRNKVVEIVKELKKRGIRIDAVGMQGHIDMDYPSVSEFEQSIMAFASCGVKVMITEWDLSALPSPYHGANLGNAMQANNALNPFKVGLPAQLEERWNHRMMEFYNLFRKHSNVITRVTLWGVGDGSSWKNDFPVHGRTDYPLAFDRYLQPKAFLLKLLEE